MLSFVFSSVLFAFLPVQQPCVTMSGSVEDQSTALLPGARLQLDGKLNTISNAGGTFQFLCVPPGRHHLSVSAESFTTAIKDVTIPATSPLIFKLRPSMVETTVEVPATDSGHSSSGVTHTLAGAQLQSLADDPDDLLRQLRQLASSAGANPSSVAVSVDGFRDSTHLPSKDSIESITIDPDLYSAEFGQPPYNGGRIEVRTKPGQKNFHGSLFAVNGSPFENARDPFAASKAAIGKQRYGAEITGPVTRKGSDFIIGLEYRAIDSFAAVDAVTLDSSGNLQTTTANIATPQRLYLPTARLDWQLNEKDVSTISFTGLSNTLQNVGVGGLALAETGYSSRRYDNVLRLSDFATSSAKRLLEARLSLRWDGEDETPNASMPQVQVAGSFTGGGSPLGNQHLHELKIESDDDVLLTSGHHTLKLGAQFFVSHESNRATENMNGSYLFGGGTAPVLDNSGKPLAGQTQTISGLEQYRRSLLDLPGSTPTSFEIVTGSPFLSFTQFSNAWYAQDEWDATKQLHLSLGLRYYAQTQPTSLSAITPRVGIAWAPSAQSRWTVHAHAGLFGNTFSPAQQTAVLRLDGRSRANTTVYNPTYGSPMLNAIPVTTVRSFSPHFTSGLSTTENVGATYTLPFGWQLSADVSFGRITNAERSVNVNAPFGDSPFGSRPGALNANNLQEQNSGKGRLDIEYLGVSQQAVKWAQIFFGAVRIHRLDDLTTPQDSRSNLGEFARSDNQPVYQAFGNGLFRLPKAIQFSTDLYIAASTPYNILTGFDNNGDGNFNDRPQFATKSQPGAIATPYGYLVSEGGNVSLPRNRGTLPPTLHLDVNLQRRFALSTGTGEPGTKFFILNIRSANVTNHLNVVDVGNVLGSPLFGVPYAGDSGRRVEVGLRYSF